MKAKQDGDTQKLLLRELRLLFSVLRPLATIPSETWQGYAMALSDLTYPQVLLLVPAALKRKWEWLPQPAELREIIYELESHSPKRREAQDDCEKCLGTGFKMEQRTDGAPGEWAVPCECRNRQRAAPGA